MAIPVLSSLLRHRRRHVAITVLTAGVIAALLPHRTGAGARDRSAAVAEELGMRGLSLKAEDIAWVDPPRGVWGALGAKSRAVVRAAPAPGEPNDLYLVHAALSPEGVLLDVGGAYNLTETRGADEDAPVVRGERVAYVARPLIEGANPTIHVLELSGQEKLGPDWSRLERLQNAVTNAQQTGQLRGVNKRTFAIEAEAPEKPAPEGGADPSPEGEARPAAPEAPPARPVEVALDGDALVVRDGDKHARLALGDADVAPPPWLRAEMGELARPGNIVTWSVDRVRDVIGDDAMQTIKAVAFAGLEVVLRNKESITGDNAAEDIAAELGQTALAEPTRSVPTDPEIGWPPAPLEPWVTPALPGEGQWNQQDKDPFIRRTEGLAPAFVTTYIRPDRTRKVTRVFITIWDPRQVELHMMAGTVEPKGATGEAGPGLIPRDPAVMKRVVAASNAGFQALHGEFGMMADGVVYLPPKPYGATVAVLRDGSTAFGTWPEDQTIPPNVLSYRQNMTVMVQDEKFNPYGRNWWGGTPPGWADKTHTVRTGICLTREKFVAYFYGADLGPEGLAQSMIQTRCTYGIALDMNAGHSGLEFYKVAPSDEMEPLGRPLSYDWEAEGSVPGLDGWKFRGRRFIRGMGLMNFPRYIKREARDFFYMTLRHVLPGPGLAPVAQPPVEGEGQWRVKGLPQHGFPYALAVTDLRIDPARPDVKARVVKIDPRTLSAAPAGGAKPAKTVAVLDAGSADAAGPSAPSLWYSTAAFSIAPEPPVQGAIRLATGAGAGAPAIAAACVSDEDGMLLYAELSPAPAQPSPADGKKLDELLAHAGCSSRLMLSRSIGLTLGGDTDLAGAAVHPPSGPTAVRLVRAEAAGGRRIMEDTPVVPFNVWYPLQQKRIRYFKRPQKAEAEDASSN
jgi:hypothetical protein